MYFTLLVVVILTAIALVAVALGIARAIQSRLLSIRYPLPDVRCGNSIFIPLGCSGTRPRSVRSV